MKKQEPLSKQEIMNGITMAYRELVGTEISHRNMPNIINRGRAVAGLIGAIDRLEKIEARKEKAVFALEAVEKPVMKKLKPVKK
jgi:hypothetical protein